MSLMNVYKQTYRFSSTSQPSLRDYIYANSFDGHVFSGIALYDSSHHLPIFVNFTFHPR